jgi:large repetitive protein
MNASTLQAEWDTPYSGYATVSGGKGPYTWGAVTGLPPGLSASGDGARLNVTGTPAKAGDFNATMTVSDSSSPPQTATGTYQVFVQPTSLTVTVNLPKTATVGQPYSGTVTATGGDGTYSWGQVAFLPQGLAATANGGTLTISGTPIFSNNTVTMSGLVSDGEATTQELVWSISITVSAPPITLTSNMPLTATVGQPYFGTVTASGGDVSDYTWYFALLPGLKATENGATVTISGTPTTVNPDQNGNMGNVSVTVVDVSVSAALSFPVVVSAA